MRYLSVCSGIEAATVAWHPLGWTPAGFSEIEAFPRAVLQERLGAVAVDWDHRHSPQSNILPLFGDFTKIEAHHVGPIDLLVGGTPCQSFSVAGKRLGLDDPRGHLTLEYLALAKRLRPRWVVWENVPGVLSDDGGRTLGTFLRLLGELGYRWAYRVLDAQFARVGGFGFAVPQRRRRVFVVGHLGNDSRAAAVLFDRESLRGNPAPRRQSGQGVAYDVAPSLVSSGRGVERCGETRGQDPVVDGNDWMDCAEVAPTLNTAFGDKLGLEDQHINRGGDCLSPPVANCLTTRMHKGINTTCDEGQTLIPTTGAVFDVDHSLRGEGFDASEDGTGRGTPLVPIQVAPTMQAGGNSTGGDRPYGTTVDTCESLVPVTYGLATQQEPKWAEELCPTLQVPSKSGGGQPHCVAFPAELSGTQVASSEDLSPALSVKHTTAIAFSAKDHGADAGEISPTLRSRGHDGSHSNGGGQVAVCFDTTQITSPANYSNPQPGDPAHPLAAGAHPPAVAIPLQEVGKRTGVSTDDKRAGIGIGSDNDPMFTLQAGAQHGVAFDMRGREGGAQFEGLHEAANIRAASGGSSRSYVAERWAVRRLTPRECERLQGFPDDWTLIPYRNKPAADGPRYKAIGNSMAVNVMRFIGERIAAVDELERSGRE